MSAEATIEQAVVARLKGYADLTQYVGGAAPRVYPQATPQNPAYPFVTLARLGAETVATLAPNSPTAGKTKKYLIRVDTEGATEAEANAPAAEVVNALHSWSDRPAGVQGAFHTDSEAAVLDDGTRVVSHTFAVWFKPPAA